MPSDSAEAVRTLARLARLLERRCGEELSLAHFRVLAAVADGDERASRVAERLTLGKPAVSAAVDALVTRGLLRRCEVESDQRAIRLEVTADGRETLDRAESAMTEALETLARRTGHRDETVASLVALGSALDGYLADRRS
jgi:DNA-binding MarR family transcriptional regulator